MKEDIRAKKVLLFYNPHSGNGLFKNNLDHIIARFQEHDLVIVPVRAAHGMQIRNVLKTMHPHEYRQIIAAGGDGTINICVNAMIENDITLPLSIFPAGTANDFAYYFELPSDIEKAMDIALGDKTTKADVGKVNGKYFINVAALGNMVDVSQKTDPYVKNAIGPLAYYLRAAAELNQVHPIKVRMTTPDEVMDEEIYFMTVCNGESAGGFRKLSPQSKMNDGKLDVLAFRKMPLLEFGPLLMEVISGRHPNNKHVIYFQTPSLTIESEEDIPTDIDGEHGEKLPLKFGVLKKRLDIFVDEKTWNYD
jgi:YegS/Rv2252/BmrU family lipid kinase